MYYYVHVCTYLSTQFPKHGVHSVVFSLGKVICCTVHGRVIPWYLNIIKQCQSMKNVQVSSCSTYLYIPYLIMLFQHIPVCTSMYKYNMICTILYQHIPVCTSTYLFVQIWPFLSEVSGFQMTVGRTGIHQQTGGVSWLYQIKTFKPYSSYYTYIWNPYHLV